MVVTFTATRSTTTQGRRLMRRVMRELDADAYVSGAATGGDTVLATAGFIYHPEAQHHICVPDYPHNSEFVETAEVLADMGRNITIHHTGLPPLARDDYMLDLGDVLYAFPRTGKEMTRGSGTWATIRHARKRKMPIYVFTLDGERWTEYV